MTLTRRRFLEQTAALLGTAGLALSGCAPMQYPYPTPVPAAPTEAPPTPSPLQPTAVLPPYVPPAPLVPAVPTPAPAVASVSPSAVVSTTSPPPPPATPTAASHAVVVAHTNGQGVYLHASKRANDRLKAYREGTVLDVRGPIEAGEGRQWLPVRASDGVEGWVAAEFTAPAGQEATAALATTPRPSPFATAAAG